MIWKPDLCLPLGNIVLDAEFIIEKIQIDKGNILNLIDWCNDQLNQQISVYRNSKYYSDIYVILEELCLYKIKNE